MSFKKRGIILVSTLLFVAMIVMFSVIITQQAKMALDSGSIASQSEKAYMAALSGIEFAKCQVGKNSEWGKRIFSSNDSFNDNGFAVKYNSYNVKGMIDYKNDGSYDSSFDISFRITGNCPYRSYNNINSSRVISKILNDRRAIPANSLYIVSKGTCGKHIRYVEALIESKGYKGSGIGTIAKDKISISGIEGEDYDSSPFLSVKNVDSSKDGILTAFGSGSFISVLSKSSDDPLKLMSFKNKVSVNSPDLTIGSYKYSDPNKESISGLTVNPSPESDPSYFDSVESYEETAASTETSDLLPSGTYVFINDLQKTSSEDSGTSDVSGNNWMFIAGVAQEDPNVIINSLSNASSISDVSGVSFRKNDDSQYDGCVVIDRAVKCDGDLSFAVINKNNDGSYSESDKTVDFYMNGTSETNPMLMSDGDIYIGGEVTGSGKIYSKGDISFNAGSVFETKRNSGVGIYAEGNVDIKPAKNISTESYKESIPLIASSEGISSDIAGDALSILSGEESGSVDITPCEINNSTTEKNTVTISNATDRNGAPINMEISLSVKNSNGLEKNDTITISIKKDGKVYSYSDKRKHFKDDGSSNSPNYKFKSDDGDEIILVGIAIYNDQSYNGSDPVAGSYYNYGLFTQSGDYLCDFDVNTRQLDMLEYKTASERSKWTYYHYPTTFDGLDFRDIADSQGVSNPDSDNIINTATEFVEFIREKIANGTEIKGTVFSKGDINVNASRANFSVIGSLVAPYGGVYINEAKRVSLMFDPDYSSFFENTGIVPDVVFTLSF